MHFVEDVGLLLEQGGILAWPGRIVGWLLICDPPHQSTSQLAQVLGASKASISTMTRLLIQMGLVEQVGCARTTPRSFSHQARRVGRDDARGA